jgi:hypothetical protein
MAGQKKKKKKKKDRGRTRAHRQPRRATRTSPRSSPVRRRVVRKTTRRVGAARRAAPRTAKELFARSQSFQEQWKDTTHVVSKVREGASFQRAVQDVDTSPPTIVRIAGSTLRRLKDGRYVARARDHLLRVVYLPDDSVPGGLREVATRDSQHASLVSLYWRALHHYLSTGDATAVDSLRARFVLDTEGQRVPLLTDLPTLNRLADAGVLSFESIYVRRR